MHFFAPARYGRHACYLLDGLSPKKTANCTPADTSCSGYGARVSARFQALLECVRFDRLYASGAGLQCNTLPTCASITPPSKLPRCRIKWSRSLSRWSEMVGYGSIPVFALQGSTTSSTTSSTREGVTPDDPTSICRVVHNLERHLYRSVLTLRRGEPCRIGFHLGYCGPAAGIAHQNLASKDDRHTNEGLEYISHALIVGPSKAYQAIRGLRQALRDVAISQSYLRL